MAKELVVYFSVYGTAKIVAEEISKQTGADIHAIGDGGFGGCSWPKNVYQLSVTMKGEHYTWFRMASVNK